MLKVRFVGLDVHKVSIVIAVADAGRGPAERFAKLPNDWGTLLKHLEKLEDGGFELRLCYEAGPTGFGLYRRLREAGYDCQVVAPALVPVQAGNRVKTDRRDAKRLAHFLRSGDLTEVHVPDAGVEALRDLERARGAARKAERVARQQLSKFLLRHGRIWDKSTSWTTKHFEWIRTQRFEHEAQRRVLRDMLKTVEDASERAQRLSADLEELVHDSDLAPLITALQALRGFQVVSAATVAAEVADFVRFPGAKQFMSYVGLVSSEDSSGERRRQGSITRAGNGHLRKILIEAAWHYRQPPTVSAALRERRQRTAEEVNKIAWQAQKRLYKKFQKMVHVQHKLPQVAVTAIARELAGFVWAIGQQRELVATSA